MRFYTRTELYIYNFMRHFNITEPKQLTIENISNLLNLPLYYWEYSSESVYVRGKKMIFINQAASNKIQWQEFGHELCHILWHVGRQEHLVKDFYLLQEWQADHFAYHFCVPTFMLQELKGGTVYDVMNLFNVEYEFALRRLEMYKNNFIERIAENARTYS